MTKEPAKKSLTDLMSDIATQQGVEAKPPVAVAAAEPTREEMLAHLAREYNSTPAEVAKMLKVGDMPVARSKTSLPDPDVSGSIPVLLKRDYWGPKSIMAQWSVPPSDEHEGNNRIIAGTTIYISATEARRLLAAGVCERADPLTGE